MYTKALLLALHKLKISEEQRKSAIDRYEPLVSFALSCGLYSSPAVRSTGFCVAYSNIVLILLILSGKLF